MIIPCNYFEFGTIIVMLINISKNMKISISKKKQKGLILLIGIIVGAFIFFGGFKANKNISESSKEKVKIEVKSVITPVLYRFFS